MQIYDLPAHAMGSQNGVLTWTIFETDWKPLNRAWYPSVQVTDAELSDYVFDVLAKDGDLTAPGPEGLPPLMVAAHHGFTDILNTILDLGVDVNSRDKDGYTALMYAARGGHVATIKALISKEADVNLQGTKSGGCPTHKLC